MGFPLETSGHVSAQSTSTRESVKVLQECIDLQTRKSQDYQNPSSNVTQAMHYRRGIDSIHDIMQGKLYRAQSLLESNTHGQANFESLEDSYKDLINYASFAVAWLRGKMEDNVGFGFLHGFVQLFPVADVGGDCPHLVGDAGQFV